jgi:hypothetical protein
VVLFGLNLGGFSYNLGVINKQLIYKKVTNQNKVCV